MNERIEKLLEQCQIETYGVNGELLEIGVDAEKFAELIVRECIGVVEGGRFLHDEAPTARFARECSQAIKRHFGSEESKNQLICPKCGVDRFNVDCPNVNRLDCGIKAEAQ